LIFRVYRRKTIAIVAAIGIATALFVGLSLYYGGLTSSKTVTSATTLSFSKSSSPVSINYVVITTPNCSTYHFVVNVTDSGKDGAGPPFTYVWGFDNGGGIVTSSNSTQHTFTSNGSFAIDLQVHDTPATPTRIGFDGEVHFVVVVPPSVC
jgi:PKD domain